MWVSQKFPAKGEHIPDGSSQTMLAIPNGPTSDHASMIEEKEKLTMSSKNNNKINVPEARAAMDKFKMEAAADFAVSAPS